MINILNIFCEIAIRWMRQLLTDPLSKLVQVMAWCRQATSHYLSQCWPRSLSPYDVIRPKWVKTKWLTFCIVHLRMHFIVWQCLNFYLSFIEVWSSLQLICAHDDVIKWKHFQRYRPFVQGIHCSPVNSPHKGQWRGALMFSLIWAWTNGWVNNGEAGDLRRHCAHYNVIVMNSFEV